MPLTAIDKRIRAATRAAILYYVQEDLEGGELFMKEVWEMCSSYDDDTEYRAALASAKDELRKIIATIGGMT